ncbi:ATP-binding cassette domain-containing protein [Paenibacillus motobuensis]|uniref:Energy-coupling factor ABC transporter ATP-binding protein n=1 Tax=Paenibacillus motobuensis TaxID=295324 RepID=A0ABP3I509_9BACL
MNPIISLKDVWLKYDSRQEWTLQGVNITIYKGEWITIIGANGSGKSTLIRLMNGLLQPSVGEITVCGMSVSDPNNLMDIRQNVGMVFQNVENQIVGLTVEEDTRFGLHNIGITMDEVENRCRDVWELLEIVDKKDNPSYCLSGGEKQKLAIAGILVIQPEVIIFDESTSMLDAKCTQQMHKVMYELYRKHCTIIQVTNDVEEILNCSRLVIMHKGSIRFDGPPLEATNESSIFTNCCLLPPFSVRMRDIVANCGARWLDLVSL